MRQSLRIRLWAVIVAAIFAVIGSVSTPVAYSQAPTSPRNKGLYITPVRRFVEMPAGSAKDQSVTVGNFTDNPMTVRFSAEQFTVADSSYAIQFAQTDNDWVKFDIGSLQLKPNESRPVTYHITVPATARPGGQYFTLFATATGAKGDAKQQVQVTSLLYLTVQGELTYGGGLAGSSVDHFVWGDKIPFTLDITNTGNTHYFAYLSAKLSGPLTAKSTVSQSHLLLPGKSRHLSASIPSPVLPGLYTATYGYKTEFQPEITRVSHIVYMPLWSVAFAAVAAWVGIFILTRYLRSRSRRRRQKAVAERGSTSVHHDSRGDPMD